MTIKSERWKAMRENPEGTMTSICDWLVDGRGLLSWVRHHSLTYAVVWKFIAEDEPRREAYEAAMVTAGHALFDRAIAVLEEPPRLTDDGKIDSGWVALQRAKSDVLKWQASRLNMKYADRQQIELHGTGISILDALREARQRTGVTLEHEATRPLQRSNALPVSS
jgi:hypothetical protein